MNQAKEHDEKEQYKEAVDNYMNAIEYLLLARKCKNKIHKFIADCDGR